VELWVRNADRLGPQLAGAGPLVVGDLGCGNQRVRGLLANSLGDRFTYQGYDLQPQSEETIKLDLRRALPEREFDLVFALGLLEYLPDPEDFLARMRRICTFAVVSYALMDSPEPIAEPEREARGWLTHYTRTRLEALSERAGWIAEDFALSDRARTGLWLWRSSRS